MIVDLIHRDGTESSGSRFSDFTLQKGLIVSRARKRLLASSVVSAITVVQGKLGIMSGPSRTCIFFISVTLLRCCRHKLQV